ncbi:MAG: hypothetical protein M0Z36_14785 [Thermaerobacter sp.]|nr:hypothetical protein [Thermaerobacter sp.]
MPPRTEAAPVPAGLIAQDLFTSTNVAPLVPRIGQWTTGNGALQVNTVAMSTPDAQAFAVLPNNASNFEESATVTVSRTHGPWRVGLIARASQNPHNTDKWAWILQGGQVALLNENVGWVATAPFRPAMGQAYHMTMLVEGTTVDGKIWAVGQPQPTQWTVTGQFANNATATATNGGIYCARAQATVQDVTLATPPPALSVSPNAPGGVFAYGQPVAYTATVANPNATTGEYQLTYTLTPLAGRSGDQGVLPVFVDGEQRLTVPITLNPPPHGYYTLSVSLTSYQSGQALETSPPISVGIVPNGVDPLPAQAVLGMNANLTAEASHPTTLAHRMALIAEAGFGWYRLELDGFTMNSATDIPSWSATNQVVEAAQQAKLSVLGLLTAWPPGDNPFARHAHVTFAQALQDERQWVQSVVAQYEPGGTLAQANGWGSSYGITTWELWNEPTTAAYWPGTAQQYAAYAQTIAQVITTAEPNATVLAYADQPTTLLQSDNPPAFTALAIHYYPGNVGPNSPTNSVYGSVQSIQTAEGQNGQPNLPLWITETGWSTHSVSPVTQAEYLVRGTLEALTQGVQKVFIFTLSYPGSGFGIEQGNGSPKPAYVALAAMARRISGFTPSQSAVLSNGTAVVLWQSGSNTFVGLWRGHGSGTLTLPSATLGTVTGWTWLDQSLPISAEAAAISVSQQPTYLQFANTPPQGALAWLQQATWTPIAPSLPTS